MIGAIIALIDLNRMTRLDLLAEVSNDLAISLLSTLTLDGFETLMELLLQMFIKRTIPAEVAAVSARAMRLVSSTDHLALTRSTLIALLATNG